MLPVVFYAYNHVIFMILFSTFAFFSYTHFSIFIFNGYLLSLTIVGHVLFYFMCIELFFIPVCVCFPFKLFHQEEITSSHDGFTGSEHIKILIALDRKY